MYVTHDEMQKEGIDAPSARLDNTIALAQNYIELMTGQFFELKTMTMKFDGGKKVLFLPVFAYSLTGITIDGDSLDEDDYTLYNRFTPDDRFNPKVIFKTKPVSGNLNIELTGEFGFVESDGSTPEQIKKVCKKLVIHEIPQLTDDAGNDYLDRSRIVEEDTDGHSYRLSEIVGTGQFTGDPEIDRILSSYQAPIGGCGV